MVGAFFDLLGMLWNDSDPLNPHYWEWHEVENASNVESTNDFVNKSSDFVESGPVSKFDVSTSMLSSGWIFHDLLQMVVLMRFKVKIWNFNDDLESSEVNDTVLDCLLIGEQPNINIFAEKWA